MSASVLIVEDEPILGRNIRTYLNSCGYKAHLAGTLAAARDMLATVHPHLIFVDQNLPDGLGLTLIEELRAVDPWTKVAMITAHGGVKLAVEAIKAGANDYISKPAALEEIGLMASRLLEEARREGAARYLNKRDREAASLDALLGTSLEMGDIRRRIRALHAAEAASPDLPGPSVLISGETGSGKSAVARVIHFAGRRAEAPFIVLNCANLSDHMTEAELFGYERGAFPGAIERGIGLFEAAQGGTLLLDEVSALGPSQQAKLLQVLEDGHFRAMGSVVDRQTDVHVLATSNAPLRQLVAEGLFRADLFFRLAQVELALPPLRRRGQDVLQIAEAVLADVQTRLRRPLLHLAPSATPALLRYDWPGNIRELGNVIERTALLTPRDELRAEDLGLPETFTPEMPDVALPSPSALDDVERRLLIGALRDHRGNVSLAAQALGVSRDTMRYRMEKYALRRDYYTA